MNHISDVLSGQQNQNNIQFSIQSEPKEEEKTFNQIEPQNEPNTNLDIEELKRKVYSIKDQLDSILRVLDGKKEIGFKKSVDITEGISENGDKIIEGVFNGEKMVGPDGQEYSVPPNYASKSRLLEGDLMKLTITNNGKFLFKQIGPIKRKRIIAKLEFDQIEQKWEAFDNGKMYKLLTASITFFRGKPSDEVVILVPEDGSSQWAAVENVISK